METKAIANYVRAVLGLEISEDDISFENDVAVVRPNIGVDGVELRITVDEDKSDKL